MVQLTLPRGSKPTTGKVHKAAPGSKDVKTYKADPEAFAALAARVKARPSWKQLYAIEGLSEWA